MLNRVLRTQLLIAAVIIASPHTSLADACPIELKSIVEAGRAASGTFTSYHVRIGAKPQTVSSITLALKTRDGATSNHVEWRNAAIPAWREKEPGGATLVGTFDKRTADVVAATIANVALTDGAQTITCEPVWVTLGGPEDVRNSFGLVNDKTHPFDAGVESETVAQHSITESSFVNRVQPLYPYVSQAFKVQGESTIRVTVEADGHVSSAIVAVSSQNDALDSAAVDAAKRSTFKPPLTDGKPTRRDYLIVYSFVLDSEPAPSPFCSMTVSTAKEVNGGPQAGVDWFQLRIESKRSDVVSAVLGLMRSSGALVGASWTGIRLPAIPPKEKSETSIALLPWSEEDIRKVWVDSVVFSDGTKQNCKPFYALVDSSQPAEGLLRASVRPSQVSGVYTELSDPPTTVSYPTYPETELAQGVAGEVGIDVLVQADGKVASAFVSRSSTHAGLDRAALDAAVKNRYPVDDTANAGRQRLYYINYGFEDQPW